MLRWLSRTQRRLDYLDPSIVMNKMATCDTGEKTKLRADRDATNWQPLQSDALSDSTVISRDKHDAESGLKCHYGENGKGRGLLVCCAFVDCQLVQNHLGLGEVTHVEGRKS